MKIYDKLVVYKVDIIREVHGTRTYKKVFKTKVYEVSHIPPREVYEAIQTLFKTYPQFKDTCYIVDVEREGYKNDRKKH